MGVTEDGEQQLQIEYSGILLLIMCYSNCDVLQVNVKKRRLCISKNLKIGTQIVTIRCLTKMFSYSLN